MPSSIGGISPQTVRAYREAQYEVEGPAGKVALTVGAVSNGISLLMKEFGVNTGALLTAYNPHSQCRSEQENVIAQQALDADLAKLEYRTLKGSGRSHSGDWPAEKSIFVFDISLFDTEKIARQYEQNGFLWIGSADGFCSLRLLGPLQIPSPEELSAWRQGLPSDEGSVAAGLSSREQAALMSVPDSERRHWLLPASWRLDQPWPYTRPDGSTMGIGTELDRNFKLIAAGMTVTFAEYM
jgi:hypothetical protein